MERQKTIKKEVSLKGIGLHTGNEVEVRFKPASPNTGINFLRVDLAEGPLIRADVSSVLDMSRSLRRTSIAMGEVEVHTIEHLMAALAGLEIDNILIEIDNKEVPGLDGSTLKFLEILKNAGIVEQEAKKNYFLIREPIWFEEDGAAITILPYPKFKISYTLSYNHPFLKAEFLDFEVNPESFERELASSRTFCLEEEVEELKDLGLGKGANYDNTLVVSSKGGVIKNRLRYDDEFIRHKVLDLIGDLYLLGRPIIGHIIALKSGHPLNLKFLKKLQQQKERLELGGVKAQSQPWGEKLTSEEIMQVLPHRYPFLLVDKIISLEKGKRAVGIKNVTINDGFFTGHFPGRPVMPGVLIIEAMAQVGGVLMLAPEENRGKLAYFLAADNVKFRKTVVPGDQLILEVDVIKTKSRTGQVHTKALVDGKVVAEADLMFALVEG